MQLIHAQIKVCEIIHDIKRLLSSGLFAFPGWADVSRNKREPVYDENGKPICGAKTRKGTPCKGKPMANGRCRMHGGTSPGAPTGNQNARTHGVWSNYITDEEEEFLALPIEERMERLQGLAELRAFRAHKAEDSASDDKKATLHSAFVQNGKLAATIAQARIRLDDSDLGSKDKEAEGTTGVERIRGVVGVLNKARNRRACEDVRPPPVESGEPSSD